MSLLENAKKEAQVEGTVAGAEATPKKKSNSDLDNYRKTIAVENEAAAPKKKSNSEYQKRQRELAAQYGKQLKDYFGDKVPEQIKDAVAFFAREKKAGAGTAFGKPVIYKIFGDTPKKGAKITATAVFENTGKGFAEMRQLMKKWSKNGITVNFDEKSKSYVLDSDVPAFKA